jgi:uncharacterized protein YndB with AHSA1/START domain
VNRTIAIAPVHKEIVVEATAQRAFEVFTAGIDRWWPKSHGIGATPLVASVIEPFVGGRWYSRHEDGSEAVVGHVRVWEPGARFIVSWEINSQWKPDARIELASEVEVRFVSETPARTRVVLEHRNFERMGHEAGETMRKGVDGGWPGLLELFARAAAEGGRS